MLLEGGMPQTILKLKHFSLLLLLVRQQYFLKPRLEQAIKLSSCTFIIKCITKREMYRTKTQNSRPKKRTNTHHFRCGQLKWIWKEISVQNQTFVFSHNNFITFTHLNCTALLSFRSSFYCRFTKCVKAKETPKHKRKSLESVVQFPLITNQQQ